MIRDFVVRDSNGPLLGTEVEIKAQDGHSFAIGNNIRNGDGIGELGAGWPEPDGMVAVTASDGKHTTPRIPLSRITEAGAAGEMGIKVVDGPFGPQTRLEITLPFVEA